MSNTSYDPSLNRTVTELSISEIERLAKAGVACALTAITPCSDPPEPQTTTQFDGSGLEDAVWDRWKRSKYANDPDGGAYSGMRQPFRLLATQHNDKVWLSVHPTNFSYDPFQLQDATAIFPSDALMAQLALWEEHHR